MLNVMHIEIRGFTQAQAQKAANFIKINAAAYPDFQITTEVCTTKKIAGVERVPHFNIFASFVRACIEDGKKVNTMAKSLANHVNHTAFVQIIESRFLKRGE